ncbi:hypothetical protein LTR09_009775 [Extremus antarcticus]|uniref:SnoaL-like domain-containing protein n=1 Tax=Extremus antarcticus TaxID=702011 RepID=A0AAJ0G965_9PEZI|nr:hypothetical protein LTR09_009775 [Extremus antarcticus]
MSLLHSPEAMTTTAMDTTSRTRAFIQHLFSDSFGSTFLSHLSDNIIWTATGSSPLSGRYEGKQVYQTQVLDKIYERLEEPPTRILDRILVDGEWATVHFHSVGVRGKNGADFSMDYCWIIKVDLERREVVEVVGFYDSKKMWDLFA